MDAGGDAAQAVAALDELVRLSRLAPDWSWRRCAVIARDWRRLEPVRAYAEALGIPIDMANETLPSPWRLREMQSFILNWWREDGDEEYSHLLRRDAWEVVLPELCSQRWRKQSVRIGKVADVRDQA